MKRIYVILLGILIFSVLFSCEMPETFNPVTTETTSLLIPQFYQWSHASRAIAYPATDNIGEVFEAAYIKLSPALTGFVEDTEHSPGDTVSGSYLGNSFDIATSKSGDDILYSITDSANSLSISISYNTVTKKVDYNQKTVLYASADTQIQETSNVYTVISVGFENATLDANLNLQTGYALLYYQKKSDGSCSIYKAANSEFYSSSAVHGFVYSDATEYEGADIRATGEIPSLSNFDAIVNDCNSKLNTSGSEKNENSALWYSSGTLGTAGSLTGQNTEAQIAAALPWTTNLSWTYKYTVTYDTQNMENATAVPGIAINSLLTKPSNPAYTGYNFAGWFKDSGCTEGWNFSTDTVTANTSLYGKWTTLPVYSVSFETNGGNSLDAFTDIEQGSLITAPAQPVKDGSTFTGWYKDASFVEVWVFGTDTVTEDITLYAKWDTPEPDIYIVGTYFDVTTPRYYAAYWKNGVRTDLSDSSYDVYGASIAVSGSDVYVTGHKISPIYIAKIWKNGVETDLGEGVYSSLVMDMALDGADVYVVGTECNASNIMTAVYWRNGTKNTLIEGTGDAYLSAIYSSNSNIYLTGSETTTEPNNYLISWENGTRQNILVGSQASASYDITVDNGDIYIAGSESNGTNNIAKVWKNGIASALTDGTTGTIDTYATAVAVSGTDVYTAVVEGSSSLYLFKNSTGTLITDQALVTDIAEPDIEIEGSDVYLSYNEIFGSEYAIKYRKNDTEYTVATGTIIGTQMVIVP